jgi:hypothetical protein
MGLSQINDTTFRFDIGDEYVELGDRYSNDFIPTAKINRWGGECFVEPRFNTLIKPTPVLEGNILKWVSPNLEVHFFEDAGSFEYMTVLNQKPASNIISFDIETQGLDFLYQPVLTQEEIDRGDIQPENVAGSYAVYHSTRTNIHSCKADADKYKVGKAFHIYRPQAVDSSGKKTWCLLSIDIQAGTLIIEVPQNFLDTATYPVYIDPNFGYETIGSAGSIIENDIQGSKFTCTEAGTATNITAYIDITGGNFDTKTAIYKHSDASLLAGSNEVNVAADGWIEYNVSGSLTAQDYVLEAWSESTANTCYLKRDSGDTDQSHRVVGEVYNGWPDPATWQHYTYKHSIYCTYTAAGAGAIASQRLKTGTGR